MKSDNMHIIISSKIRSRVHVPEDYSASRYYVVNDPIHSVLEIRNYKNERPVKLLLFVSLDEVMPLSEVLQGFSPEDLVHSIVVCSTELVSRLPASFYKSLGL